MDIKNQFNTKTIEVDKDKIRSLIQAAEIAKEKASRHLEKARKDLEHYQSEQRCLNAMIEYERNLNERKDVYKTNCFSGILSKSKDVERYSNISLGECISGDFTQRLLKVNKTIESIEEIITIYTNAYTFSERDIENLNNILADPFREQVFDSSVLEYI
ncbi:MULTISPECIES: hypothetical protein [Vibrio]|uniref:hypothetical protein n=1 Tax=Vibrio TaxID=662 RepID=UPI0020752EC3|nr:MULTISPECIES: hypothetical protein [Vibrio]USD33671.1 hypothetical protein J8Z27_06090 [Vibrio sp. SCSIO 43186]USD46742.1 hypothetical protein J4N38_06285 [Vibrio sp. SCSIO 43145]USD70796.1 hypothetical protein J4N41_06090 [Vibrio sp. SCSIO 43139]USD95711.1 hypothetical protein CTT30_06180 [Vibrio coralliilyticus]